MLDPSPLRILLLELVDAAGEEGLALEELMALLQALLSGEPEPGQ